MPNSDGSTENQTPERHSWCLLRVVCGSDSVELITDFLWTKGVQAVEETVLGDGTVELRTHLGSDRSVEADLRRRFDLVELSWDEVPSGVADTWRAHAHPTEVVTDHWLCPAWIDTRPTGRVVLIEPGGTFGLGDHPTTVLALRLALCTCAPGERVHDHGTGSGVLAVALTAWRGIHASVDDIAPESPAVVSANATLNRVRVPESYGELPAAGTDLDGLVANILAPVLREDAIRIREAVRTGGWIVLSGMREDQVDSVLAHYQTCEVTAVETLEGWTAVLLLAR